MEDQSLLLNLPSEITIEILSRLPIRTIVQTKCVCKSLYQLLETHEFVKFHLSKSAPGLIVYHNNGLSDPLFRPLKLKDELEPEQHEEFHYIPVTEFKLGAVKSDSLAPLIIEGSVNGIFFLQYRQYSELDSLYICNSITREYINLPNPEDNNILYRFKVTDGFGVSKITHQYKVVGIYQDCVRDPETWSIVSIPMSECRVYTLGTSSWRSVLIDSSYKYSSNSKSAFVNGNIHWLVWDLKGSLSISCFDLETELFKTFSPPPCLEGSEIGLQYVVVLGDHLCFFDNTRNNNNNHIVIWVMKEYGVEKSWTKGAVISKLCDIWEPHVYPITVLKDGTILLYWEDHLALYHSKTKTFSRIDMLEPQRFRRDDTRLHVPSFLSLKSFAMENVAKF